MSVSVVMMALALDSPAFLPTSWYSLIALAALWGRLDHCGGEKRTAVDFPPRFYTSIYHFKNILEKNKKKT